MVAAPREVRTANDDPEDLRIDVFRSIELSYHVELKRWGQLPRWACIGPNTGSTQTARLANQPRSSPGR